MTTCEPSPKPKKKSFVRSLQSLFKRKKAKSNHVSIHVIPSTPDMDNQYNNIGDSDGHSENTQLDGSTSVELVSCQTRASDDSHTMARQSPEGDPGIGGEDTVDTSNRDSPSDAPKSDEGVLNVNMAETKRTSSTNEDEEEKEEKEELQKIEHEEHSRRSELTNDAKSLSAEHGINNPPGSPQPLDYWKIIGAVALFAVIIRMITFFSGVGVGMFVMAVTIWIKYAKPFDSLTMLERFMVPVVITLVLHESISRIRKWLDNIMSAFSVRHKPNWTNGTRPMPSDQGRVDTLPPSALQNNGNTYRVPSGSSKPFGKWVIIGVALCGVAITMSVFKSILQVDKAETSNSEQNDNGDPGGKLPSFFIGVGVGMFVLSSTAGVVYVCRKHKNKRQEVQHARWSANTKKANCLDSLIATFVLILMPFVILVRLLNGISQIVKVLDSMFSPFGVRHKSKNTSTASELNDSHGSTNGTGPRVSGQGRVDTLTRSNGQTTSNTYRVSFGETIMMILVPFLIPVIFAKARKRNRTMNSPATTADSNPGTHRSRPSVARTVVQSAISRSFTPGRGSQHFTRTDYCVRPIQSRNMGRVGRPIRCKCTIL